MIFSVFLITNGNELSESFCCDTFIGVFYLATDLKCLADRSYKTLKVLFSVVGTVGIFTSFSHVVMKAFLQNQRDIEELWGKKNSQWWH